MYEIIKRIGNALPVFFSKKQTRGISHEAGFMNNNNY